MNHLLHNVSFQGLMTPAWLDGTKLAYPLLYSAASRYGTSANLKYFRFPIKNDDGDNDYYYDYNNDYDYRDYDYDTIKYELEVPNGWNFLEGITMRSDYCWVMPIYYFYEVFVKPVDCDWKHIQYFACHNLTECSNGKITYTRQAENQTNGLMTEYSVICAPGQFQCEDKQCILDIFVCDSRPDCNAGEDEQVQLCQSKKVVLFSCSTTHSIPLSLTCDGKINCVTGNDEDNCFHKDGNQLNVEIIPLMYANCNVTQHNSRETAHDSFQNDLLIDCPMGSDEQKLYQMADIHDIPLKENVCARPNYLPCFVGHTTCFHKIQSCIFDLNKYGRIKYCTNGAHLENCRVHECINMFKCPDSYCIPWRKVCDGQLDCQDKSDEQECKLYICKGMLKCRGSKICVHPSEQCDNTRHCPNGDDELLCHLPICPKDCSCLAQAVSCVSTKLTFNPIQQSPTLRFILLSKNLIANIQGDAYKYSNLYALDLSHNLITSVGNTLNNMGKLHILNLSVNFIDHISFISFRNITLLKVLDLSHNKLKDVTELFHSSSHHYLHTLDLANNTITFISTSKTGSSKRLNIGVLKLSGNLIQYLSLSSMLTLDVIYVDRELMCCFVKGIHCIYNVNDMYTCKDSFILGTILASLFVGALCAILLNIASISWCVLTLQGKKVTPVSHSEVIFKININLSNLVYNVYILLLFYDSEDKILKYLLTDFSSSPVCMIMKIASGIFMLVSPILYFQQAIRRCCVIHSLVVSHNQKWIHLQVVFAWTFSVLTIFAVITFSTSGLITTGHGLFCFPFLHLQNVTLFDKVLLISVVCYQLLLFLALHVVYKSTYSITSTSKYRFAIVSVKLLFQATLKVLFWLPFIILAFETFQVTHNMPHNVVTAVTLWTFVLHTSVQPIVAIFF